VGFLKLFFNVNFNAVDAQRFGGKESSSFYSPFPSCLFEFPNLLQSWSTVKSKKGIKLEISQTLAK